MHNRDPLKRSRTQRNRRTSSSDRSRRSKASTKDTPRPTTSKDRPKYKGTSKKVTSSSSRIKKATTAIMPRGAQGPRTPPVQGPVRPTPMHKGRGMGIVFDYVKPSSRSNKPTNRPIPKNNKASPRIIKRLKGLKGAKTSAAMSTLSVLAAEQLSKKKTQENLTKPVSKRRAEVKAESKNREKDRRRKRQLGSKPGPEAPPSYKPKIHKAPAKGKTVLAKKNGRTGYLRDGTFYPRKWSTAQHLQYKARGGE